MSTGGPQQRRVSITAVAFLREHYAWALIALTLLLFCTKTLFNVPLWIMSLIGLYRVARAPRLLVGDPVITTLGWLFIAIWLPQAVSLVDAVNGARSAQTVLPYPHYLFAAVFIVQELRDPVVRRRLTWSMFAIITFWCADAVLQFFAGRDLLGYPYTPGQLSGLFYPKIRLGHMLAMLAPVYFETIRRAWPGRYWPWLLAGLLLAVLLLSGKRVAWLMGGVSLGAYAAYLYFAGVRLSTKSLAAGGVVLTVLLGLLIGTHEPLSRRFDITLGLFSGKLETMDRATAHRLSLWKTALHMAEDHWINGVGPRGYRYVYADYAAKGDFFMRKGRTGQTHPHLMLLEIAVETGVIGLLGLLLFWWHLLRFAAGAIRAGPDTAPWFIAAGVAWLPFNAHLAFFGSYWSSVAWWMLAVSLAAGSPARRTAA